MAATIRIKRSGTNGDPSVLAQGELAYSYSSGVGGDRLYIGTGTETNGDAAVHQVIGGKYYVDQVDSIASIIAAPGILEANKLVRVDGNLEINEWHVGVIDINNTGTISTSSGNLTLDPNSGVISAGTSTISNVVDPTNPQDAATKAYVDAQVGGGFLTFRDDENDPGTVTLADSDLSILGTAPISTNVENDTTLRISHDTTGIGSGTVGSATQIPVISYNDFGHITSVSTAAINTSMQVRVGQKVESITSDSDLSFAAGEGIDVAYDSATNTVTYSGEDASAANKGIASFNSNDFTVTSGDVVIAAGGVDNAQLANSSLTVTAGDGLINGGSVSLGGSVTLDVNTGAGLTTSGDAVIIATDGVVNSMILNDSVTIGDTQVVLGTTVTAFTGLTSIEIDNIKIDGNVISTTSGTMYLDPTNPGAPLGDSGDVVILGNLTVQGTTTTINSTEVSINDLTLTLADSAQNGSEADGAGIIVAGANATFLYEVTGDKWTMNKDLDITGDLLLNGVTFAETIDDQVASLLVAGEGIDLTYNDGADTLTIDAEFANAGDSAGVALGVGGAANAGVAYFDSDQMTVSGTGFVTIYALDGGQY